MVPSACQPVWPREPQALLCLTGAVLVLKCPSGTPAFSLAPNQLQLPACNCRCANDDDYVNAAQRMLGVPARQARALLEREDGGSYGGSDSDGFEPEEEEYEDYEEEAADDSEDEDYEDFEEEGEEEEEDSEDEDDE